MPVQENFCCKPGVVRGELGLRPSHRKTKVLSKDDLKAKNDTALLTDQKIICFMKPCLVDGTAS